jgi:hypothetical protein
MSGTQTAEGERVLSVEVCKMCVCMCVGGWLGV